MSNKRILIMGGIVLLLLTAVLWLDIKSTALASDEKSQKNRSSQDRQRKIKYWQAPMDPMYIRDKPGKSPMGMDLIPVYEDEGEETDKGTIKIDPVVVQNLGVRTTEASKGALHATIRTIGHITYDETRVVHIHTKVSGWVEKLFVDTTGEEVRKGQDLLTLYSPELVSTQEEYLQALNYKKKTRGSKFEDVVKGANTLIESTKRRLLLMDIDPEQIEELEKRGQVQKDMLLRSPSTGIVVNKHVLEGMKVTSGMKLYTIADLSHVWILASVYEYEIPFLRVGQEAEMSLPYDPGTTYKGHITFIYPYLSAKTRTVQVRMEFENPELKLKPNMYADIVIKTKVSDEAILIPSEAVIRTGTRNVVITSLGKGKFLPKEVIPGPEGEGFVQILSGLEEGEIIVTSGQFLIDSESNLREAINKMLEAKKTAAQEKESTHDKHAGMQIKKKIQKIDVELSEEQKDLISLLIESNLRIHRALVSESVSVVPAEARTVTDIIGKLKASDKEGHLREITSPIENSLDNLSSEDIEKIKDSFAAFSAVLVDYMKETGKEDARLSDIRLYVCPMNKEHWLQKEADIQNPYLGKDMLICGTEVKY